MPSKARPVAVRKVASAPADVIEPASGVARRARRKPPAGAGVLVVVAGAEGRGKEMLIAIARRRFEADASLDFPARLTTRSQSNANGDIVVSRRVLREMAEAGELMCRWETEGQAFALGIAARRSLEDGRTVVVVAGRDAVAQLRGVWDDVRVVEVTSGADSVRNALGKRARTAHDAPRREAVVALHHPGDVAAAVRGFHEIIARMRLERLGAAAPNGRAISTGAVVKRFAGGASARKGLRPEPTRA